MNIGELTAQFEHVLSQLPEPLKPKGYRPQVVLFDIPNSRRKRIDAAAEKWPPNDPEVRVTFVPDSESHSKHIDNRAQPLAANVPGQAEVSARSTIPPVSPLADLVHALDRAESKPGFDFVGYTRFRDVFLPSEGFEWAKSDALRDRVLREAIEKRLILTGKEPNPRSPQYPTTSVRLNRLLPEVAAILGALQKPGADFEPIEIRGEGLSTTILRERR